MRLSISNIAWPAEADQAVFDLLKSFKVEAIEIAPTRIWPDWQASLSEVEAYSQRLKQQGLTCSSLQAILYNCPLQLFGTQDDKKALIEHLKQVVDLAVILGARPLVFGAPKNRDKGDRDDQAAFAEAVDVFAEIGDYCAQKGGCLCIEPNPSVYHCNFITNSRSGAELVRAVNSPGFRLHLDAAGLHLAGEDPVEAIVNSADVLEHFHISEPYLGSFESPQVDHAKIAQALKSIHWHRWIAIEMRAISPAIEGVRQALATVSEIYEV